MLGGGAALRLVAKPGAGAPIKKAGVISRAEMFI